MNTSIQIDLVRMDASTQIPFNVYDERGNPTGPSEEFKKDLKEAEGKSVIRAQCVCEGNQSGFVSHWFTWEDQCAKDAAFRWLFRTIGESISVHEPWNKSDTTA